MGPLVLIFAALWLQCTCDEFYYFPHNVTRTTLSGVAAYRSALTLDWLANEDTRQRELAAAFETEAAPPAMVLASDCIAYAKPASGKVARLMLELLKNLEGDEGHLISELTQALVRSKLLIETSMLDAEPDLEALVKTPGVMMGEPHTTFPRILAMVWMAATDPTTTKRHGWCPVTKVNKYLAVTRPVEIAQHLHALDPVIARARFIMEQFIQHVTPINVFNHNFGYGNGKKAQSGVVTRSTHRLDMKPTRTPAHEAQELGQLPSTDIMEYDLMGQAEVIPVNLNGACPSICSDLDLEPDLSEDRWMYRSAKRPYEEEPCANQRPSARDVVRRFYAILPYLDRDHTNSAFLHKFRGTVYGMSEGDDLLDREGAYYAAILTPLVFLQQYRDMWCLLERFHRALRLYQISHPTEKRAALKLLQNFRAVNQKIRSFISDLPGPTPNTRATQPPDDADEELHDKKDIKYLKELIKNLG